MTTYDALQEFLKSHSIRIRKGREFPIYNRDSDRKELELPISIDLPNGIVASSDTMLGAMNQAELLCGPNSSLLDVREFHGHAWHLTTAVLTGDEFYMGYEMHGIYVRRNKSKFFGNNVADALHHVSLYLAER